MGVNFSQASAVTLPMAHNNALHGIIIHLLLEWSAVAIALITAVFAFIQYRITGNISTPIIGMALFCAGCMDAFHALASVNLLPVTPRSENFIPFTWTLARIFNAVILIIGISLLLFESKINLAERNRNLYIIFVCAGFIFFSFIVVRITSNFILPKTIYTDHTIHRPYDIIPLVLFLFLGLIILSKLYRYEKGVFSHALLLFIIPSVATQLHMAFGSKELYDAHFNIAHFLKAVSYLVLFTGITLDYLYTYQQEIQRSEALKKAEEAIRKLMEKKDEFLSIASHELKTPITSMKGFLQILERMADAEANALFKSLITKANKQVVRLTRLVNSLLDVTKIQAGRMELDISEFKVCELFEDAMEQIGYDITHKIVIEGDIDIKVKGDKFRLAQVITNFLSNAIKYSPGKDQVIVSVKSENNNLIVSVTDFGIGISKEKAGFVFEKFFRAEESCLKFSGVGLGLYISSEIIKHHGGKVWAISEEGQGSTFYFSIPINQ